MLFELREDGSAVVSHIPIRPFVPVQHMQVEATTVNRIANHCLAYAREHGWLQAESDVRASTWDFPDQNEAVPLVEEEGFAYATSDRTMFYAGVESVLARPVPHFRYPPTPSSLMAEGHLRVVAVGTSSYSIYGELVAYLVEREGDRRPLGTFRVTSVQVSKALRSPVAFREEQREVLQQTLAVTLAKMDPTISVASLKVARIPIGEVLKRSGRIANAEKYRPHGEVLQLLPLEVQDARLCRTYSRRIDLRETDIDFNGHVNQLQMMLLIINAFRSGLADRHSLLSRLLPAHVPSIKADLLIRRLRIDYVQEVPDGFASVEVILTPCASLEERLRGSECTTNGTSSPTSEFLLSPASPTTAGFEAELSFFTLGIPATSASTEAPRHPFVATAGYLSITLIGV